MNYNTLMLILTLCSLSNFTGSLNAVFKDYSIEHQFLPRNRKINLSAPMPQDSFDFLPTESHVLRDICSDSQNKDCAVIRALFNQHLKIKSLQKSLASHTLVYKKTINLLCLKKAENDLEAIGLQASQALDNVIINKSKEYETEIREELQLLGINTDAMHEEDIKNLSVQKAKSMIFAELKMFQNNIDFNNPIKKMVYTQP